jgi:hypothetical protein
VKKRTAFWVALINANILFLVAGLLKMDASILYPVLVTVVGLTGIYTGFNVMDNWQRSKYFVEKLQESGQ